MTEYCPYCIPTDKHRQCMEEWFYDYFHIKKVSFQFDDQTKEKEIEIIAP